MPTTETSASTDSRCDTVLVTGASSGIGEALARLAAAEGHALVLVARSADKLAALAQELSASHGTSVKVLPADLGQPGAAAALAAALKRRRITVDVLVNNAGVLENGPFVKTAPARHQALIDPTSAR
jgi:short-subunit dehydrogenase